MFDPPIDMENWNPSFIPATFSLFVLLATKYPMSKFAQLLKYLKPTPALVEVLSLFSLEKMQLSLLALTFPTAPVKYNLNGLAFIPLPSTAERFGEYINDGNFPKIVALAL